MPLCYGSIFRRLMRGRSVFHFPWFPSVQTPAFATNCYSRGALLSLEQCFEIILGGKLGAETHICVEEIVFLFFFQSRSTEGLFKSNCYFGTI